MVYNIVFEVDGGCRRNGAQQPVGAAAAIEKGPSGRTKIHTERLERGESLPEPTSSRAELTAINLALKQALQKHDELRSSPKLNVEIRSDSKYAIGFANQDLIKETCGLDEQIRERGDVNYEWIPRAFNRQADLACNRELDEQEAEMEEWDQQGAEMEEWDQQEAEMEEWDEHEAEMEEWDG
ncbi:hypothetical protein EJ05DRAFT_496799 [Pseudovirgaria hyperparasitica]|uniref:RNase H type-1 domain-containing protein n=1 Tax=Pseudovirgaria hyperparasitica TaxID=470096 RepID=A0A6A6WJY3_9PEZI|nr:uncharacterized protein EJ05DRAFT_496799 [Pseudovirgaria hyperparasitica]KAF2761911.1 hypothetical protein EJ05DRAFT_496799 [Pseudovirgaria hyperparasitica]